MRVYTRFRSAPVRRANRSHFQWFLAALLGSFVVWIWWNNLQHAGRLSPLDQGDRSSITPVLRLSRNGTSNAATALVLAAPTSAAYRPGGAPGPHTPKNAYDLQIALARQGISVGSLDGVMGSQTKAALRAFQQREHLPVTGEADSATKARLWVQSAPETFYTVTADDLGRISPVGNTWLAKSLQDRLDYETVLELVAEKAHAHPNLIRILNPSVDWNNVGVGSTLRIPSAEYPPVHAKAAFVRIRLSDRTLEAFDRPTNLIAHFPCSIARLVEKRPVGKLLVETIVLNPVYPFKPENFPESDEARQLKRPLMIPKGPNNPVGTAWIGLSKPGYGIHGTPRPEDVGRTESHGCFRLANWNAEYLAELVEVGTPVFVEP